MEGLDFFFSGFINIPSREIYSHPFSVYKGCRNSWENVLNLDICYSSQRGFVKNKNSAIEH